MALSDQKQNIIFTKEDNVRFCLKALTGQNPVGTVVQFTYADTIGNLHEASGFGRTRGTEDMTAFHWKNAYTIGTGVTTKQSTFTVYATKEVWDLVEGYLSSEQQLAIGVFKDEDRILGGTGTIIDTEFSPSNGNAADVAFQVAWSDWGTAHTYDDTSDPA